MTDRELLELAARASGVVIDKSPFNGGGAGNAGFDSTGNAVLDWHNSKKWNPLTDDGDLLRLAIDCEVRFGVVLEDSRGWIEVKDYYTEFEWDMHRPSDRYAATRLAVVRAVAAVEKCKVAT